MKKILFEGVATALITPFDGYGKVDYAVLKKLIIRQIRLGVNAILVLGTTGEASTLTENEKDKIISVATETAEGKIPIIAGVGSNDTQVAVKRSKRAKILGADGVLAVTPYYNKTTQNGLIAHFFKVAEATELPIILYNVPPRTGMTIENETYAKLFSHPNIVGVKEASDSLKTINYLSLFSDEISIYAGNDNGLIPTVLCGGKGVISVLSNLIPDKLVNIYKNLTKGEIGKAKEEYSKYLNLIEGLFAEVNPVPIKYATAKLKLCDNRLRAPLLPMKDNRLLSIELEKIEEEINL